jgi:hypothetical protein
MHDYATGFAEEFARSFHPDLNSLERRRAACRVRALFLSVRSNSLDGAELAPIALQLCKLLICAMKAKSIPKVSAVEKLTDLIISSKQLIMSDISCPRSFFDNPSEYAVSSIDFLIKDKKLALRFGDLTISNLGEQFLSQRFPVQVDGMTRFSQTPEKKGMLRYLFERIARNSGKGLSANQRVEHLKAVRAFIFSQILCEKDCGDYISIGSNVMASDYVTGKRDPFTIKFFDPFIRIRYRNPADPFFVSRIAVEKDDLRTRSLYQASRIYREFVDSAERHDQIFASFMAIETAIDTLKVESNDAWDDLRSKWSRLVPQNTRVSWSKRWPYAAGCAGPLPKILFGKDQIMQALGMLTQNWRYIETLNEKTGGPIHTSKGAKAVVVESELIDWFKDNHERFFEKKRRQDDMAANVADQYEFGTQGSMVVPEIRGSIKRRKRRKL